MSYSFPNFPTQAGPVTVAPEDRLPPSPDSAKRAARRRFVSILIAALSLHVILLLALFLRDRADADDASQTEIPIELVTEVPPPPPAPPPPEEKKEEKKEKTEKPPAEQPKLDFQEKAAHDAPRKQNDEPEKRQTIDQITQGPTQAKPTLGSEAKPETAPARTAAPDPADKTVSRDVQDDRPDAEALDKAAPEKAQQTQQKTKETKDRSKIPNDQKAAVARQLAALAPAPTFSFSSAAKVTPVDGGTEDMRYLTVVWGLIIKQKHNPPILRTQHIHGIVVVGFFLDDTGRLVHEALYRTSGYTDLDNEAIAAVRRAQPFPPPPPGTRPHLLATIEFKE